MMLRSKRGADSTMGPMVWLIVILIVAALVIFFVAGGFGRISDLFNQAPGTLEEAVQICKFATNAPTTFCDQVRFVEINGEGQHVNCLYPDIKNRLETTSDVNCVIPSSGGDLAGKSDVQSWGKYFCAGLVKSDDVDSDTKANGLVCATLSCSDIGGKSSITNTCADAGKKAYNSGFTAGNDGEFCCL